MKFLLDNDLPKWMINAFVGAGYEAVHVRDLGRSRDADPLIGEFARAGEWTIVTGDFDFADVRNYRPAGRPGVVVLVIPRHRGSPYMRLLLDEVFAHLAAGRPTRGKLLIVEPGRIRVRD